MVEKAVKGLGSSVSASKLLIKLRKRKKKKRKVGHLDFTVVKRCKFFPGDVEKFGYVNINSQ